MTIHRTARDTIVETLDRLGIIGEVGQGEYSIADAIINDLDQARIALTVKPDPETINLADAIGLALEDEDPRPIHLIRLANKASDQIDQLALALRRAQERRP